MQIEGIGSSAAGVNAYQSAKNADSAAQSQKFTDALEQAQSAAAGTTKDKKLQAACQGFEEMFLNLMYSKMRDTVPDDPLFGSSNGEKVMQSMLDTEMTKQMAQAGGVGLADMIYKQLTLAKK